MKRCAPPDPEPLAEEAATGLPLLRTWRGVYLFVLGTFILWVVLLNLLTRMFS
jgi:hypothetical protein